MVQDAHFKELLSKVGDEYERLSRENRLLLVEVRQGRELSQAARAEVPAGEKEFDPDGDLVQMVEPKKDVSKFTDKSSEEDLREYMHQSETGVSEVIRRPSRPSGYISRTPTTFSLREEDICYSDSIERGRLDLRAARESTVSDREGSNRKSCISVGSTVESLASSSRIVADATMTNRTVRIMSQASTEPEGMHNRAPLPVVGSHRKGSLPIFAAPSLVSGAAAARVDSEATMASTTSGERRSGGRSTFVWNPRRKWSTHVNRSSRMTFQFAAATAHGSRSRQRIPVINPVTSTVLAFWDRICFVALCFVVFVTPVHVSMYETRLDAMFVLNCIIDAVFFVDMLLQFIIMYPKDIRYGHTLEYRPAMIVANYLKGWFAVDLISVIPFEMLSLVTSWNPAGGMKIIKIARILRLMKLTRVLRAPRLVNRFQFRMSMSYKTFSLLQFFTILTTITHWLTTLWAFTLALVDKNEGVPRWIDDFDVLDTNVQEKTVDTKWKLYVTCFYFTIYTLTSVGYGDIGPKNIVERIMCTFIIIISGTSWAVVLGQVSGILADMNPAEQQYRNEMDDIQSMMADQMVPPGMRHRITCFFQANKAARRRTRHAYLMQTMSPGLRGEVMTQVNGEWMTRVSLLNSIWQDADSSNSLLLRNFIYSVSTSMTVEVHAQAEIFGAPQILYMLSRGLVGRGARVYARGFVWGIDFLLANPSLLEPVDSLAMTYVEVTTVSREVFFDLVNNHAVGCPELKRHVRTFVRWLAFQRAIKYIVRKEKRRRASAEARERRSATRPPKGDEHVDRLSILPP